MTKLLLRDVGDGLNLFIKNSGSYDLTVDFGGDKNLECYHCFNENFLLTHFHADHYNGILKCNELHSCWHLDKFYHPVMPSFSDDKVFFMSLLALNIRISNNHPIQSTIFSLVRKLNRKPLEFIPVAKGDIIICGRRKYEILWPPTELKEKETLKVINTAIRDFEKAKEEDETLRRIYERIYERYSNSNLNELSENDYDDNLSQNENTHDFPEIIKRANDSLRKAANRLSVAFRQDDNILFLGDLEEKEIDTVVSNLDEESNNIYDIIISAHHGTHWGDSLYMLEADICLASIGDTLQKHIAYEYIDICNKFVRTDECGSIRITRKNKIR